MCWFLPKANWKSTFKESLVDLHLSGPIVSVSSPVTRVLLYLNVLFLENFIANGHSVFSCHGWELFLVIIYYVYHDFEGLKFKIPHE